MVPDPPGEPRCPDGLEEGAVAELPAPLGVELFGATPATPTGTPSTATVDPAPPATLALLPLAAPSAPWVLWFAVVEGSAELTAGRRRAVAEVSDVREDPQPETLRALPSSEDAECAEDEHPVPAPPCSVSSLLTSAVGG